MSNTLDAIHLLEKKIENLLSNYEFLKDENQVLLQANLVLQNQVLEIKQKLASQQQDFDLLKIAKTIQGSSNNTKDTKLKINSLIREIDKCIVQLQE